MDDQEQSTPFQFIFRRAMSSAEKQDLVDLLTCWSSGDPRGFPAKLAMVTLAQWEAAASIPMEVHHIMSHWRHTVQDAADVIANTAQAKLEEFQQMQVNFEQAVTNMDEYVTHLYAVAKEGEARTARIVEASDKALKEFRTAFERVIIQARAQLEEEMEERSKSMMYRSVAIGVLAALATEIITFLILR